MRAGRARRRTGRRPCSPGAGSRSSPASASSSAASVMQETALRRGVALSFAPPQLPQERASLAERAGHDRQVATGRLARHARAVVYAHLGDLPPRRGRRGRAAPRRPSRRREVRSRRRTAAPDELEGAVDVPHGNANVRRMSQFQRAAGGAAGGHGSCDRCGSRRRGRGRRQRQHVLELGRGRTAVGVGQQDPRHARGVDAAAQRGAVAAVGRVHDDADARVVGGRERLGPLARGVGGAVVDDDDLDGARAALAGGSAWATAGATLCSSS